MSLHLVVFFNLLTLLCPRGLLYLLALLYPLAHLCLCTCLRPCANSCPCAHLHPLVPLQLAILKEKIHQISKIPKPKCISGHSEQLKKKLSPLLSCLLSPEPHGGTFTTNFLVLLYKAGYDIKINLLTYLCIYGHVCLSLTRKGLFTPSGRKSL